MPQKESEPEGKESSPSMLYKKCFPNTSMTFKDRFPVFADILGKYNKNLKKIPAITAAK